MNAINVIGERDSHDRIRAVLGERSPAKILDVPSGEGVLAHFLRERGWDVHCADVDPGNFKLGDVPFQKTDLNRPPLPYQDETFDVVACVNGIHRLYNPGGAIREFYRILRPQGHLYINVNNYATVRRRLRFMLCGTVDNWINSQECQQTIDEPAAHVRVPIVWAQVARLLKSAGFEVLSVTAAGVAKSEKLLMPLAYTLRGAARILPASWRERDYLTPEAGKALLSNGRYILVEARKPVSS